MKLLERLLAGIGMVGALGTIVLAIFVLSQLIVHVTSPRPDAIQISAAETDAGEQPVEADTASAASEAVEPTPATPAATPVAEVDPAIAAGEKVFKKCKACHTADAGAKNKTGPNLWNVLGREVASVEQFSYSDAMKSHGGTWDETTLDAYLADPKAAIPGNKMAFAGLKSADDRANVIAYLATRSDAAAAASGSVTETAAAEPTEAAPEAPGGIDPDYLAYLETTFHNAPARSDEDIAAARERAAAIQAEVDAGIDYQRARYHPIHFPPAINEASNEECLVCHQEILTREPRTVSPAGVPIDATLAWYQTLDTYAGPQATFHWRHLESDYAKEVMNLECVFCHKGNDPREESPYLVPTRAAGEAPDVPEFTNRKMVNPSETCLLCHGAMPDPINIMGLGAEWPEARLDMEDEETINGCLTCHGEFGFRTARHNVSYLNALNIEKNAATNADTCYGCHGGRQWYQISYPYPRHPWPDMDEEVPDWAKDRPTQSKPEYQLPEAQPE